MNKEKIKYLIYEDSAINDTQTNEVIDIAIIEICGFVIGETKESITLANEIIHHKDGAMVYRGQVAIPKKVIIKTGNS